jgi:hypothetical protein
VTPSTIRAWFCLGVAVLSAAVADPVVEFASNAGWFGRGNFTDHSNLDVLPAMFAGLLLVALCAVFRAKLALSNPGRLLREFDRAISTRLPQLLAAAFSAQIVVLFVMETSEQLLAWGRILGPTIWLGGPALASLAFHAAVCAAVAGAAARAVRFFAGATLRVIRLVRALIAWKRAALPRVVERRLALEAHRQLRAARYAVGERAPPFRYA